MNVLVTGGCGFAGKYLVANLLEKGHHVSVLDNLSGKMARQTFKQFQKKKQVTFFRIDILKYKDVLKCIEEVQPDFVYHFAGQHSVRKSVENPAFDAQVNIIGTLNLLEAIRHIRIDAPFIFSSSTYVYGKLDYIELLTDNFRFTAANYPNGFNEDMKKDSHLPNTCALGAAEQYIIDYHRLYGMKTAVFRQSQIVGEKLHLEEEDFFESIIKAAIEQKVSKKPSESIEIYGNGKDVVDILYISDLVECYMTSLEYFDRIDGQILNIGGGVDNSVSKLELLRMLEEKLGIKIKYNLNPEKTVRQNFYVTNYQKARSSMHWGPTIFREDIVQKLISHYIN